MRPDADSRQSHHQPELHRQSPSAARAICTNSQVKSITGFNKYYGEATDSSLEQSFQQVGQSLTQPRLVSDDAS